MWPDRRIIDLFKTEFPIVLAPMAGIMDADLVIAAAQGGALGSLPCAMISADTAREQVNIIRQRVSAPVNMNFFCHQPVDADPAREAGWKKRLGSYYGEFGLDPAAPVNAANRAPFDETMCALVEELKPEVVSFHFGLPDPALVRRVKAGRILKVRRLEAKLMRAARHVRGEIALGAVKGFSKSDRGVVAGIDDHALNQVFHFDAAVDGGEHRRTTRGRPAGAPGIRRDQQFLIELELALFQRLEDDFHRHQLGEACRRHGLIGRTLKEIAAVLVIHQHSMPR